MTEEAAPRTFGRRELIVGAGAAALGAVVVGPGRGAFDGWFGNTASPFDRSLVAGEIGERFRVTGGAAKGVVLKIAEIRDLPMTAVSDVEQQFLVRFAGPGGDVLAQGTYEFASSSFGRLPLFITPMSDPGASTAFYDAIVNRVVPATQPGGVR